MQLKDISLAKYGSNGLLVEIWKGSKCFLSESIIVGEDVWRFNYFEQGSEDYHYQTLEFPSSLEISIFSDFDTDSIEFNYDGAEWVIKFSVLAPFRIADNLIPQDK